MDELTYTKELTRLFNDRNCTVTWINESECKHRWDYNTIMFFEDEMGKILGPKTPLQIIKHIYSFGQIPKSVDLFIHVLSADILTKIAPDNWPQNALTPSVLYYNYTV